MTCQSTVKYHAVHDGHSASAANSSFSSASFLVAAQSCYLHGGAENPKLGCTTRAVQLRQLSLPSAHLRLLFHQGGESSPRIGYAVLHTPSSLAARPRRLRHDDRLAGGDPADRAAWKLPPQFFFLCPYFVYHVGQAPPGPGHVPKAARHLCRSALREV